MNSKTSLLALKNEDLLKKMAAENFIKNVEDELDLEPGSCRGV